MQTLNNKMTFSILNANEIGKNIERVVCIPPIQVEGTLEREVTYPKGKMIIKVMQREIDDLKKKLHRAQRKRSPSSSDGSSNDEEDDSYRRRSKTTPSESFSYDEEHHHWPKYKSPPRKGTGNYVMNKALNQISKSPFTRRIEGAKFPRCFHQPTFTIYNGRTDLIKRVS